MLSELKAGSDYESLLRQEFKKVSQKEVIPRQQEEMFNLEDTMRLQQNLTKNNLNTIISNAPGLINDIIQEIINTDGDTIEFNKYFNTFRTTIGNIKIRSLEDFNKLWNQFKTQQLGKKLTISPEVNLNILTEVPEAPFSKSIDDLTKMSNEEIDSLFREAIKKQTGKDVKDINSIVYYKADGNLSRSYTLTNKDSIIGFDPPLFDSREKSIIARNNNAKIRYIYHTFYPTLQMRNLIVKWRGSQTPVLEEPKKGKVRFITGFGLKKKRLGRTRYH